MPKYAFPPPPPLSRSSSTSSTSSISSSSSSSSTAGIMDLHVPRCTSPDQVDQVSTFSQRSYNDGTHRTKRAKRHHSEENVSRRPRTKSPKKLPRHPMPAQGRTIYTPWGVSMPANMPLPSPDDPYYLDPELEPAGYDLDRPGFGELSLRTLRSGATNALSRTSSVSSNSSSNSYFD